MYVLFAALLWSTGGIGIKAISDSALKVAFYRSVFAAIALMLFLPRASWATRTWRSTRAFAIAIISYAACLTSFVVATKWTTAANAIFLQYAGAVWVLLLSPIIVHEPIRRRDVIAICGALAGMALFFFGKLDTRGMSGNAVALLSSVFFASLILSLRRDQKASVAAVTWGNVACAVAVLPFIAHDLALTPVSAAVLLFLGIVSDRARVPLLHARPHADHGDSGFTHRHGRADRQPPLGLPLPWRAPLGLRDLRIDRRAGRNRLAYADG